LVCSKVARPPTLFAGHAVLDVGHSGDGADCLEDEFFVGVRTIDLPGELEAHEVYFRRQVVRVGIVDFSEEDEVSRSAVFGVVAVLSGVLVAFGSAAFVFGCGMGRTNSLLVIVGVRIFRWRR